MAERVMGNVESASTVSYLFLLVDNAYESRQSACFTLSAYENLTGIVYKSSISAFKEFAV